MISRGSIPLISLLLYRLAVWKASRRVATGDLPAVQELAAAFCDSPDSRARDLARQGLRHLQFPGQAGLFCRESILRNNDALAALARECGYLPPDPAGQALWFFCTSRIHDLRRIDPEEHSPLLSAGYAAAEEAVRAWARDAARRDGTERILARALAGSSVPQNAGSWSYGEWEVVVNGFSGEGHQDDLWLLAPLAPLPLAMDAIRSLVAAGWSPRGDDCLVWENLLRTLPDRRDCTIPAAQPPNPVVKPAGQVSRLCFSPDGSLLATGSCDGLITVWRTGSAGLVAEISVPGPVSFLSIPPGNSLLISTGGDGTIRCNSLEDRTLLWSHGSVTGGVFALSPGEIGVPAGESPQILNALGTRDGQVLYSIPLHPAPVSCTASSGPVIACGHRDGTITIARIGDDPGPQYLPGNGKPVSSLSFSASGAECLAVYEQGPPLLWDVCGCRKLRTFTGHEGRTTCTAVPAGRNWFAVGSGDHVLRCWNTGTPAPASIIPLYNRRITSCSGVPGGILAAGFHDGLIRLYRMPGGVLLREYRGHKKSITSAMLSPDGTRLATVSWDGTTRLWRVPGGEIIRTFDTHAGGIAALAGPAGNLVASVTGDGIARVTDASDGMRVRTIDLYTPSVRAAAMSPDGTYLAVTGADFSLRIWNIRDGSLVSAGDRHATSWRCCTFLPGGSALVTGGWDGTCRIFRVPDAVPLKTLSGHTSTVACCAVSRDGSLLVTGSNDTTIRLWRTGEDAAYAVLRESRSEVSAVALSPDGTLLAAGSSDGVLRFCRLPYGIPDRGLPGLPGKVTALAFTGNGCILAAGYDTGTCALFSVPDRSLLRTLPAHNGAVTGLAVLPDGRTLVSTGADGLCRFHALPVVPFLVHASLSDIETAPDNVQGAREKGPDPAAFHRALLAARFRGEIGVCPPMDSAGSYDIQVVG